MPLPQKLKKMLDNKEVELTYQQIEDYLALFQELRDQKSPDGII